MNTINENSNEIDLKEIVQSLWNGKIIILCLSLIFSFLGIYYSLSLPNIYKSEALVSIVDEDSNKFSTTASQYSGLASLAGVNLPSGNSISKDDLAIEIIKSREFLKHLITFEDVMPQLMAAKSYDHISKKTVFDEEIYDYEKDIWLREPSKYLKIKPTYLEIHKRYISEHLVILKDSKTGFVSIGIKHISPEFSYYFLNLIIQELNNIVRLKNLKEAEDSIKYLKNRLTMTDNSNVRMSINRLIETQIQVLTLSNIRQEYLLKTIDAPFLPETKHEPNRAQICLIFSFFGLIISCFVVLFRKYFYQNNTII